MENGKIYVAIFIESIALLCFYVSSTFLPVNAAVVLQPSTIGALCILALLGIGATVTLASLKKFTILKNILTPFHAVMGIGLILSITTSGTMAAKIVTSSVCAGTFAFNDTGRLGAHLDTDGMTSGNGTTNEACYNWLLFSSLLCFNGLIMGIMELIQALGCATVKDEKNSAWTDEFEDEGFDDDF